MIADCWPPQAFAVELPWYSSWPPQVDTAEVKDLLSQMDEDGNGRIDFYVRFYNVKKRSSLHSWFSFLTLGT